MDAPPPLAAIESPRSTARLILRAYERDDLAAFHDLFSREDVCRYIPFGPMDLEQARDKLELRVRQVRIDADGDALLFAVVEAATGRMIGELMLRLASAHNRQGEIGWAFHPDAQGRGLATEGARELLRIGFDEMELHRITAGCDARHGASLRVMERLGMRREAELIESELLRGEWASEIVCAMLASEWRGGAGR
jgi:RimJ/RimL family protein N-acetyltransferase